MSIKFEYSVVDKDSSTDGFASREEARSFKRNLASYGIQSKIVQKKYELVAEKAVR